MRFGVVANFDRPDAEKAVDVLVQWCRKNKHDVFIHKGITSGDQPYIPALPEDQLGNNTDIIISLGGDGTMLATARILRDKDIPILGINLGSLGFLTQLTPDHLERALARLTEGDYKIEKRLILKTEIIGGPALESPYALNDIVIDKGNVSRVINLSLYADGEYICSYTGDGLIIATPTGSTAYSLAVGGPIINPDMEAAIVSPISPFSLTSRPIVFPPDRTLEVKVRSEHGHASLTIDGQVTAKVAPKGAIRITRAGHSLKMVTFADNSFYSVLRKKLHWGKLPVVDFTKSDLLEKDTGEE